MLKRNPPQHRHDGTSPLPLGMDWSPPPKRWEGRNTVWPHDPRTGWSYCVTVPSWTVRTISKTSEMGSADPVVFYRVRIGLQSPESITTTRELLRRFSDFLKLQSALKHLFPRKNLPSAPSKHRFLRMNSSQLLLEERRCILEEWMSKLLSDIDVSRSAPMASFLELEAAARLSFQEKHKNSDDNNEGSLFSGAFSLPATPKALSIAADCCSDTSCEISDMGTPRQGSDNSGIGSDDLWLDQHFTRHGILGNTNSPSVQQYSLQQLEESSRSKLQSKDESGVVKSHVNALAEVSSELKTEKYVRHAWKSSMESVGSDTSSIQGNETTNAGASHLGDSFGDVLEEGDCTRLHFSNNLQVVLPLDHQNKINRVIETLQRRLVTAKTDMEDLIARLNQEIAVKEYLTTKIKDLDVELETTKQKSKENLQQAVFIEREQITQMQWDMEELRRKCSEMEAMLKFEQDERRHAEMAKLSAISEKESVMQEFNLMREELGKLKKYQENQEVKLKADAKILVKEVKFLRKTQADMKQEISHSQKEKAELERILQIEKQRKACEKQGWAKLLHECEILRHRLQECSVNFLTEEDQFMVEASSVSDAMDLLKTSDDRIGLLLAEAQLLAQDDGIVADTEKYQNGEWTGNIASTDWMVMGGEVRKMLTDIFVDNARLRKKANSVIRCALRNDVDSDREDGGDEAAPSRRTVLSKFLVGEECHKVM